MSSDKSSNRPYDVLIVEDSADDVELFLRTLRKVQLDTGIEINVQALSNSNEASAQLKMHKFDAIFLDVGMLPPDGLELARRIRSSEINRTTPIVIITGGEDRGLMARAFQAGVNLFLFKPINRTRLLRIIETSRVPIDRERRRLQRIKVKCRITIESEQGRFDGETVDMCLNGMLVKLNGVLPVGSLVSVTLVLPRVASIRIAAHIVRMVGNDLMELQLDNLDRPDSERLGGFLAPLIGALAE